MLRFVKIIKYSVDSAMDTQISL